MAQSSLYYGFDGYHEIPVQTYTNAMGQTVQTSGAIYDANGKQAKYTNPVGTWGTYSFDDGSSTSAGSAPSGTSGAGSTPEPTAKDNAANAHQSAIDTLLGGVTGAQDAANLARGHILSADADLGSARRSAAAMTPAITNLTNTATALTPYAQTIGGYGDELASLAGLLTNNANNAFGQASALFSMDPGATGIAKEFMDLYALLSPDRYVSQAASDAQSSFNNMMQQLERQNARRGLSAGSGASMALKDQMGRALAAALAATKTRARQMGIDEKSKMLSSMTNAAQSFYNLGTEGATQAANTLGAAANAQNTAAGLVVKQGDIFSTAGQLSQAQANTFANIGGVEVNLGQLELSNEKLVQDALASVASAQQAMAKFYQDTMEVKESRSLNKYGSGTIRKTYT